MRGVTKPERWWLPGSVAIVLLLLVSIAPLLALLVSVDGLGLGRIVENRYYMRVIRFSMFQALLSTLLSIALAIPVAIALSREYRFKGRQLLVNLFSLSLVLPTIVAIYGVVAVYGRTGWFNQATALIGIEPVTIYGLPGILIAHVFFNMPLAVRILLQTLDTIPAEQWRLSAQLRMRTAARWRYMEWPALRGQLPGIALLIFALCFTSFTIVLTLGGGPRATTIEVAIYQALRFDFDLATAVTLAIIQLLLCTVVMLASTQVKQSAQVELAYRSATDTFRPAPEYRWVNWLLIATAALFVLLPLLALLVSASNSSILQTLTHPATLTGTFNTFVVSLSTACISVGTGIALLYSSRHMRIRLAKPHLGQWLQLSGNLILVMPPVVLGTGLFMLLRPFADVFALALLLAILINSLMALPFVLRILDGPMMQTAVKHDRIIQSLGIRGWNRWRWIDWPQVRKPLGLAMGVSASLAAGDMSAIALFGSDRAITLPLLLFQRMGSYRLQEAAVTAALLLLVCLGLFLLMQRVIGGRHAEH